MRATLALLGALSLALALPSPSLAVPLVYPFVGTIVSVEESGIAPPISVGDGVEGYFTLDEIEEESPGSGFYDAVMTFDMRIGAHEFIGPPEIADIGVYAFGFYAEVAGFVSGSPTPLYVNWLQVEFRDDGSSSDPPDGVPTPMDLLNHVRWPTQDFDFAFRPVDSGGSPYSIYASIAIVPEPGTAWLASTGLLAVLGLRPLVSRRSAHRRPSTR
jgi:hypothetical protein